MHRGVRDGQVDERATRGDACYASAMSDKTRQQRPEREATDESLAGERRKTDDELAKRSGELEENADDVVAAARARADEVLDRARVNADAERRRQGGIQVGERDVVEAERRDADVALDRERADADDQLSAERMQRRAALSALLALEREQTDDRLLDERERADRAIGSRDEFLAMVSHDARSMLGGIALSAAALMNTPGDEAMRTSIARDAQRIQRFTARMNRLVSDLLDVVSIEAGRLAVAPQRHDATELLRETVDAFQALAATRKLSIMTEVRADTLLARYDHERVLQVLANLVGNAMKFTPPNGRIGIVVENVDDQVRFAVSDTGPGIPAERLSVVFDRFWQLSSTTREGLGLGLYISRCIVEAHGGRLWAESRVGEGSTFYFTLPASAGGVGVGGGGVSAGGVSGVSAGGVSGAT